MQKAGHPAKRGRHGKEKFEEAALVGSERGFAATSQDWDGVDALCEDAEEGAAGGRLPVQAPLASPGNG